MVAGGGLRTGVAVPLLLQLLLAEDEDDVDMLEEHEAREQHEEELEEFEDAGLRRLRSSP